MASGDAVNGLYRQHIDTEKLMKQECELWVNEFLCRDQELLEYLKHKLSVPQAVPTKYLEKVR